MDRVNNLTNLKSYRNTLRNHLTPPEARLWVYIKGSQLGVKFRRQHSVGNYILDFYCPVCKLAIEIDGSGHDNPNVYAYDMQRTSYLETHRIVVLRFTNNDIMNSLDAVLIEIKKYL